VLAEVVVTGVDAAGVVEAALVAAVAEAELLVADLPLPPQPSAITATADRIKASSAQNAAA
jgi:hypothetical protein